MDLINRQDAIDEAISADMENNGGVLVERRAKVIDEHLSIIPAAEPKKGRWVDDGTELGCCCSECGITLDNYFDGEMCDVRLKIIPNFCPNCGAEISI